ncbi:MAG: hypothetical protein HC905_12015 [Bacteroidales bacterium]|nr:hypothetical protein [Bacteroidales bacterium]
MGLILTEPKELKVTTQTENIQCNGGGNGKITAMVEPGTGTPEYTYLWSNGETTATITNVSVADYHLTVTDGNGCEANVTAHVLAPDPLDIKVIKRT